MMKGREGRETRLGNLKVLPLYLDLIKVTLK